MKVSISLPHQDQSATKLPSGPPRRKNKKKKEATMPGKTNESGAMTGDGKPIKSDPFGDYRKFKRS